MKLKKGCSCGGCCTSLESVVKNFPSKESINKELDKELDEFSDKKEYEKESDKVPNKFYSVLKSIVDYFKV